MLCLLAYGKLIKHSPLSLVNFYYSFKLSISYSSVSNQSILRLPENLMDFKYVLYSCCCFLGPNASRITLAFVFRFPCVHLFGCSVF